MLSFAKQYGKDIHSQNNEDGIIEEILSRIDLQSPYKDQPLTCSEFGAADGFYCSNTRALIEKGWQGFLYDTHPSGDVKFGNIDASNVNYFIPDDINVLSIDVDGDDYFIWKAYKGTPAIVVIEINSSIPPNVDRPINTKADGCGYRQMVELGINKNYFIACHTGNLIFVRSEYKNLFPEIAGNPLTDTENYFNSSWLKK